MISMLALAFSWLPQDPTPAERLRAVHREVVVEKDVAAVEKALAATPDGRLAGVVTPAWGVQWRQAGIGALDFAGQGLRLEATDARIEATMKGILAAWRFTRQPEPVSERPDLRDFERVCSHAHRDLVQALGSGRELEKVAPELLAAIDQLRGAVQNIDDLTREDELLLRQRLERLAKVDAETVHLLAVRIVRAAMALDRDDFREAMRRQPPKSGRSDGTVVGDVLLDRDTPFGRMVVGGFGRNEYDCSAVDVIVDLGGDDSYRGPAGGAGERRRLAVVVDLDGNDVYDGGNDALGCGVFGIGVLVDLHGNDSYKALARSAGFGLGGVGILIDADGEDRYDLGDQSGGCGFAGTGMLLDAAGADLQTAGVQSFGCGLPGGLGLLIDCGGDDVRRLGVERKRVAEVREAGATSDQDGPRRQDVSVGFGVGVGVPPLMSAGVGVMIDLAGQDRYEAGGLAVGVGVRGGIGVFRDAAGDDTYVVGDVSLGAAYAHGLGIARDEGGADAYEAGRLALGSAWGNGIGLFVDGAGDDAYRAVEPSLGAARRSGVGGFLDLAGRDTYTLLRGQEGWSIVAKEETEGTAVGVFLHLGGAEDTYAFDRLEAPENDRTRMLQGGDERSPERRYFVDR